MILITRIDRGGLARWWFTVDRQLLSATLLLMAIGVLISMAASPRVAERIGLDAFHFFRSHLVFLVVGAGVLLSASFLDQTWVRRVSLIGFAGALVLMVLALFIGPEIKGAHRWINLGPLSLQPSELAKPTFIVAAAWFLAQRLRHPDMPGHLIAYGLSTAFIGLLVLQPDFGQTILVVLTFGTMLLISGLPWIMVFALLGAACAAMLIAYFTVAHVASRIDRFIHPASGDTFQVDTSLEAFRNGGLLGTGPGGGTAKLVLPDAHTDFAFAVVGEEFGVVAAASLMVLFFFIIIRVLRRARHEPDPFAALAMAGLATMFGLQAVINMGVNLALLPAKGMTLPFVSYGGSSLIGTALGIGLVLALGRSSQPSPVRPADSVLV